MNYKSAWITLNRACNLKCLWCYGAEAMQANNQDMDFELACKLIDLCAELKLKRITLIGGEPTIYPNLFPVIDYIHSKNMMCSFPTNGLRLQDMHFTEHLIEKGIKHFSVSLKGENNSAFQNVTCVDGFDSVIKGIKNIIEKNCTVTISMVLTPQNIGSFIQGVEHLKAIGVKRFRFSFCYDFNISGQDHTSMETHPRVMINKFMDIYNQLDETTNHQFKLSMSYPLCLWDEQFLNTMISKNQITSICQLLNKSGLIFDTDGTIIPCNAMHQIRLGKYDKDFSNAEELNLYMDTDEIQRVYSRLCGVPHENCLTCKNLSNCGGGCVCNWTNYSFEQLMMENKQY